ncbi:MAG: HAD-IA family hydrolase [Bryobacterales bacterium]|nr:HAD-IA family hydrolase [Bryobacterales bacterium]
MDLVIFDLDGTLIDSALDLVHSVNATRRWLGMPELDPHVVASYVGNGAPVLIRRAIGPDRSDDDLQRALDYFLAYYRDHMLDNTRLYPGVQQALDTLRDAQVRLAVLTNKPVRFSQAIVDGLGLGSHFCRVYGGNSFPDRKKPDPIGIDTLRQEVGAPRETTLMVGDSAVDVKTARNARVRCAGVTFGFQPETFEQDPPDYLIDRMEFLAESIVKARA